MTKDKLINWGISNPKKVFQLDGLGAMLSAVLLGVVLVKWESVFGIPTSTLYLLAAIPCLFAVYDFYCYLKVDKMTGAFLKGIALANLLYCALSIGLALSHLDTITLFGWAYIIGEIVLVTVIALFELSVSKRLMNVNS